MIVTLDGPAGAGKSTVARGLARRLGFDFLDTGSMYRAVALAGVRAGVDFAAPEPLAALAAMLDLRYEDGRIFLAGEDVSRQVRTPEVTAVTRFAADNEAVRRRLIEVQRRAAAGRNIVSEGRDQGTLVFPDAECKFFLTATAEERARRRVREFDEGGIAADFDEVLTQQRRRDDEDAGRAFGALRKADDAMELSTDGLSIEEVLDRLETLVRARMD